MCYILYGAINDGINSDDYKKAIKDTGFHFNVGDIDEVNRCVNDCKSDYRITSAYCDCETAIGQKKIGKKQLKDLEDLFLNLRNVRGVKYVLICKNWYEEINERQETVHIDDVDIINYLANMEDNCLYKIELYKKYF